MNTADRYAPAALVVLTLILCVMVAVERWPTVRWWWQKRVRQWKVQRAVWLMEQNRPGDDR